MKNRNLFGKLELNRLTQFILEKCTYGTPIFKLGDGGNKILILSGIHGNELSPQIANVKLLNELLDADLKNTLYFIPFASPKSTMYNERTFNDMDLNRSAHIQNSLSNLIVQAVENLAINFVGDFHSTGSSYKGAVEDVCNLKKIPAVTCEVLCPFANVIRGSVETSLAQMKSFLDYFGI